MAAMSLAVAYEFTTFGEESLHNVGADRAAQVARYPACLDRELHLTLQLDRLTNPLRFPDHQITILEAENRGPSLELFMKWRNIVQFELSLIQEHMKSLETFIQTLETSLGSNLRSLVLFGSAALQPHTT